ncbi:hypothetical protein [Longimicrobium sp.]|uniref:hypothetical protein n=1 Tax=Longimicrobium sp. TaxID=2029185 RepID=UPI002CAAE223|nr:hypothetical protein [Longimicrobium sp.]HSU15324.1 hypothetical protein [Longimicrobium sp.]
MRGRIRKIRRWAGAAAVTAALGFGAAQAVAAPTATREARACDPDECATWCASIGGVGQCVNKVCRCII